MGLSQGLGLTFWGVLGSDTEILSSIESYQPAIVAIDAPLSLPRGLCCLEEPCPCHTDEGHRFRNCERDLARRGIPCFFTTKKSIIKKMVYRGIRLKVELCRRGFEVVEVYPFATKVRLWRRPLPRKTTAQGIAWLRERLREIRPALGPYLCSFDHNLCDAALAAYTAFLCSRGQAEPVGDEGEGFIYIPR